MTKIEDLPQELYQDLISQLEVAVIIQDSEDNLVYLNILAGKICNTTNEAALGLNYSKVIPVDEKEMENLHYLLDQAKKGIVVSSDLKINSSGTVMDFEINIKKFTYVDREMMVITLKDFTSQKILEKELKECEKKFQSIFETLTDTLFRTDLDGTTKMISPSISALIEYEPYELIGENIDLIFKDPKDINLLKEKVKDYGFVEDFESVLCSRDSDEVTVSLTAYYIYDSEENPIWIQGVIRDISDRKMAENELVQSRKKLKEANVKLDLLSRTDPLTKLSNRRDIMEKIQLEELEFKIQNRPFAMIIADIDKFKSINDTFGHDTGDIILKQTAATIQDQLRQDDVASRWGGEEFLILLPGSSLEGARILAERIRQKVEATIVECGKEKLQVTLTLGISIFDGRSTVEECIKQADNALYCGKENGRNQVVVQDSFE